MYRITYMHKDSSTENVLYTAGDNLYSLLSGSLDIGMGKSGELNISLQSNNPAKGDIVCLTDEFIVYRRNVEIFRGRAVTLQKDFELTDTLAIEGCLSYLYDTFYPPFDFHGKPDELLTSLLANHNSKVENRKKIYLGNVTVADKNDYIYRASEDYMRTLDILSDRFISTSLGGYFRIRVTGGTKYLDYLQSYGTTATQAVQFGENILDIAQTVEYGDLITAIIPLGKKNDETGEFVTVKSVNAGKDYIQNTALVNTYGFICDCVHWEDVEVPSNLYTKGNEYLQQASVALKSISIKAVDLAIADPTINSLNIGDSVQVISQKHGINQWIELSEIRLDLVDPRNDDLTFGAVSTSFTKSSSGAARQIAGSLSDLTVNFHKVAADYVTAEYLNANYVAINDLSAEVAKLNYATVNDLTVERGRINDLYANKADVTQLNVANGKITTLESGYGNIVTLLSGNAGVGDLQAIHLTTSNAAIDAAVIRNIVSQYITVNDLVAGAIDTSKFRISSPDGRIEISGNTQKFKDANGNVRMQIGQDAQGNFTFVLYDATGQGVLMDSTGIKPSAIADGLITDAKVAYNANISASKLDIGSLFSAINNDSNNVISASKIYLNEQEQTLVQMYTQFSTDIELANDNADDAVALAQQASANADAAIRAVEGIASLDNVTAVLSNDSHVVHTNYDGTGGSYTFASTKVSAYKGDADISSQVTISYTASQGLFGTWNASTRVYQVTALTTDDGYVDFEVTYTPTSGTPVVTTKRFSISKSPDGRAGSSYNLQVSANVLQKSKQGAFTPASVILTAVVSVGSQSGAYSGKFKVEESLDGSSWEEKYVSSSVEGGTVYYPTVWANFIRCTLMDENNSYLDAQTVTIIADTNELAGDLVVTNSAVLNLDERVGTVETGVGGLRVDLQTTREQLQGVSDNTFFYTVQSDYSQADTVNLSAHLYREKRDIHDQFPPEWFTWHKKTEEGIVAIGSGYTIQIRRSNYGFGGTVVGRFSAFEEALLALPNGDHMVTPNGLRLAAYYM